MKPAATFLPRKFHSNPEAASNLARGIQELATNFPRKFSSNPEVTGKLTLPFMALNRPFSMNSEFGTSCETADYA